MMHEFRLSGGGRVSFLLSVGEELVGGFLFAFFEEWKIVSDGIPNPQ